MMNNTTVDSIDSKLAVTVERLLLKEGNPISLVSQNTDPPDPPLRPASVSSPRNKGGGKTHSPGKEGDGGGQYFGRREK
jgi:hypothetical protein